MRGNRVHDIGVATHIGRYSDAIETAPGSRLLFISGTPGVRPDGHLPDGVTAQSEQAWANIFAALDRAGMNPGNLVKIAQYVLRPEDIQPYVAVRSRLLGDARPASTLLVVPALVRPGYLVEIEAFAAGDPPMV